jgi:hypothetical protein
MRHIIHIKKVFFKKFLYPYIIKVHYYKERYIMKLINVSKTSLEKSIFLKKLIWVLATILLIGAPLSGCQKTGRAYDPEEYAKCRKEADDTYEKTVKEAYEIQIRKIQIALMLHATPVRGGSDMQDKAINNAKEEYKKKKAAAEQQQIDDYNDCFKKYLTEESPTPECTSDPDCHHDAKSECELYCHAGACTTHSQKWCEPDGPCIHLHAPCPSPTEEPAPSPGEQAMLKEGIDLVSNGATSQEMVDWGHTWT